MGEDIFPHSSVWCTCLEESVEHHAVLPAGVCVVVVFFLSLPPLVVLRRSRPFALSVSSLLSPTHTTPHHTTPHSSPKWRNCSPCSDKPFEKR